MEKAKINAIKTHMEKVLGADWNLNIVQVNKMGGEKDGIQCKFKEEKMALVLYPGEEEEKRIGVEGVAEKLARIAEQNKTLLLDFPSTEEEIRERFFIQLVNADGNKEFLRDVPYDSFGDIVAVARLKISKDDAGEASSLITRDNIAAFHMTPAEVMEQAYKNTAKQKFELKSLNEVIEKMLESYGMSKNEIKKMLPQEKVGLYVLTNNEKLNGANALVCPEVLKNAYEQLGEPYYILPSSIHEVLLVKQSEGYNLEALREMVKEVNRTEVRPEEILSSCVFKYNGQKLSIAQEEIQTVTEALEKKKKNKFMR